MPEVSALALLDRLDEARAALERVKQLKPDVTCGFAIAVIPITHASDREHFVGGLIKAGLPE